MTTISWWWRPCCCCCIVKISWYDHPDDSDNAHFNWLNYANTYVHRMMFKKDRNVIIRQIEIIMILISQQSSSSSSASSSSSVIMHYNCYIVHSNLILISEIADHRHRHHYHHHHHQFNSLQISSYLTTLHNMIINISSSIIITTCSSRSPHTKQSTRMNLKPSGWLIIIPHHPHHPLPPHRSQFRMSSFYLRRFSSRPLLAFTFFCNWMRP